MCVCMHLYILLIYIIINILTLFPLGLDSPWFAGVAFGGRLRGGIGGVCVCVTAHMYTVVVHTHVG